MKKGLGLQELAVELERQTKAKRDFVADTSKIQVVPAGDIPEVAPVVDLAAIADNTTEMIKAAAPVQENQGAKAAGPLAMKLGDEYMPINQHALRQVGSRLKIPARYIDRLAAAHPDLLAENINTLFTREPEKRLVRTMDGNVRAFMSERYRCMDNWDFANVILPILFKFRAEVKSCDVTEHSLYIKAILPEITSELPIPDGLKMGEGHNWFARKITAGVMFRNSEVGKGTLEASPCVYDKWCTNFAVFKDSQFKKYHLGSALSKAADKGTGNDLWELFSDDTRKATDEALWKQVQDVTTASMDGRAFERIKAKLLKSRGDKIQGDPAKLVEVFAKDNALGDDDKGGILRQLIEGAELTRFGLHNAVTRHSQDVEDYEQATALERLGGSIIEMPANAWTALDKAA